MTDQLRDDDGRRAVDRLLTLAGRRLALRRTVAAVERVALPAAGLVLVLAAVDRLPVAERAGFVPWTAVLPAILGGAVVAGLLLARRDRADRLDLAMLVDEALGLRGRIAAAVSLEAAGGPFAAAAIRDAESAAAAPGLPATLARRLPVRAGRGVGVAALVLLLALATPFVPPLGLWGGASADEAARAGEAREARREVEIAVAAVAEQLDASAELKAALGEDVPELAVPETPGELEQPEEIRRDALKRMTELRQKLDEIVEGERGRRLEALEKMMEGLEDPGEGPARDLANALRKGDFASAKQALEELMRKAEQGELSDEQSRQLQEQLGKLAEQLQAAAENRERLEEALKKAGLDPRLASSPEALQQAIAQSPNLNEEQRRALQQLAEAQAKACAQCNNLANAMSAMAGAMSGPSGAFQDAASSAMQQLSSMEQLAMMLQQANAMMSQCEGRCMGLGQGLGQGGLVPSPGSGRGRGPGGGQNPVQWAASGTTSERVQVESGEGEIIARMLVDGDPTVGESRAVAREVVRRAARGFDEAMTQEKIPPRYREAMRRYFGALQEQAERAAPPAPPAGTGG